MVADIYNNLNCPNWNINNYKPEQCSFSFYILIMVEYCHNCRTFAENKNKKGKSPGNMAVPHSRIFIYLL